MERSLRCGELESALLVDGLTLKDLKMSHLKNFWNCPTDDPGMLVKKLLRDVFEWAALPESQIRHDDIYSAFDETLSSPALNDNRKLILKHFFTEVFEKILAERRRDIVYGTSTGANLSKIYANLMKRSLHRAYPNPGEKREV